MSRPDYDPSQEEITKLRLLLNQAESQRDAFKGALHSEVKDIMRRAVSQATYDARYDAEASLKEYDEAENTISQLKAKLENRDREVAALKAEADRFKAERDAAKRCWDSMKEEWDKLVDENIRLRKAGDAMAEQIYNEGKVRGVAFISNVDEWNAAKEGKPSV